jgi:hypothetical protein
MNHDEYVARLLAWFAEHRIEGRVDWHRIVALSAEFAEYFGLVAPSAMSLAKALARRRLRRGHRYLLPHERGYRTQVERGGQRPRARWLELPKAEISPPNSAVDPRAGRSRAGRSA